MKNKDEITDFGISPITIVEEMTKEIRDKSDVMCNFYQWAEDVPDPKEPSSEKKNLLVFDDLLLEKQNTVRKQSTCQSYYLRGDTATLIVSI